jgi:hypothetical protein
MPCFTIRDVLLHLNQAEFLTVDAEHPSIRATDLYRVDISGSKAELTAEPLTKFHYPTSDGIPDKFIRFMAT